MGHDHLPRCASSGPTGAHVSPGRRANARALRSQPRANSRYACERGATKLAVCGSDQLAVNGHYRKPVSGASPTLEVAGSAIAFFRAALDQYFRHQHQTKNLSPFGDDVADDLSPLRHGIASDEEPDPCCTRYHQEYREGVALQEPTHRADPAQRRLAALGRSNLVEVLGCENGDQKAGPVGDGVAEE